MNTRKQFRTLAAVLITAPPFLLNATAAPLAQEGPVESVAAFGDGSAVISVMAVSVNIPAGTSITSPTATLDAF